MGSSRVAVLQVRAAQAGVRRGDRAGFVAWASAAGDARYVAEASVKGGAAIDWDDPGARKRFLGELVTDADHRLEWARRARGAVPAGRPPQAGPVPAAGPFSPVACPDAQRPAIGPLLPVRTS